MIGTQRLCSPPVKTNITVLLRTSLGLSALVGSFLLAPLRMHAEIAIPGMLVSVTRPQIPLLIRNETGPLLEIIIEVGKADPSHALWRSGVRVTSLSFSLEGTESLLDLQSLSLLSHGAASSFSAIVSAMHREPRRVPNLAASGLPIIVVGEPHSPAPALTFFTNLPLRVGKNYFWLSGRLNPKADLNRLISAHCTAIETSLGKFIPGAPTSPAQRIGVALRRHLDDGVHTYRIPALATTAKGSLLAAYDIRRLAPGQDLQDDIDIGISRSTNGGSNWEPVRVIMDMGEHGGLPQAENGVSDPGLVVDQKTGTIFCFAVWMNGKAGHHQWVGDGSEAGFEIGKTAQFLMVRSDDDGQTWSKPKNLTSQLKKEHWRLLAPSPQQGIQLADGTLVMPVQGRINSDSPFSTLMTSRDHGETWKVSEPVTGVASSECQAVELGDGTLMLNMRTEDPGKNISDKFRSVFITRDLGQTWEPHATHLKALIEPNCNASLIRAVYEESGQKRHALLFTNPHSQNDRTHQTIQVSFDEGQTWPKERHILLDEGRGAGYPSLTQIDAKNIGIVYEGSQSHLIFQRISLAEILRQDP